ncbi:zinc-binding oxidoreductase CipB [Plenodomus tracheiphilus IPT5]|uniref:Zinc-binding oxidoreductase CipB n=1 Tax=Plenodomus tracheiphilus IPT5 TaxID=1408161 RepID=A0A6A7BCJ2_9PLEO|nr:zinc-binding oxidoreductase CipB [Plenodomus tracheiphilus IPT5]
MYSNAAAWINAAKTYPLEVKSAPTHTPGRNEILVRNYAVAVNHIDAMIQETAFHRMEYPTILGQDVAGEVVDVGPGVTRFTKGDRILGHSILYATQKYRDGAFQKYTIVRTDLASELPDDIPFEEACVVPVGLSTAACALFQESDLGLQLPASGEIDLTTRKTVLIWGGSSSVGSSAIQLSVAAGYDVIATASPHNFEYVRKLGANQVFDHQSHDIVGELVRALSGKTLAGALDAIGFAAAIATAKVVQQCQGSNKISTTLPVPTDMPDGVIAKHVRGDDLRETSLGRAVYQDFLPKALKSLVFVPAPNPLVVGQGLEKVQDAINLLRKGVSAQKLVIKL